MRWFSGTIPEAIQKAKSTHSVFIVFVEGEDEQSKSMMETWASVPVTEACEKEHCVAVKISANSDECSFFSQIYPVVVVPSVYFIGENGVPLEVTGGLVEPEAFVSKIESVVQSHKSQRAKMATTPSPEQAAPQEAVAAASPATSATPPASSPTPPALSPNPPASSPTPPASSPIPPVSLPSQSASAAPDSGEESPGAEADKEVSQVPTSTSSSNTAVVADLQDRVERVKALMEEKKAAKEKEAAEALKEKEQERRRQGKDLQKLKQYQEDSRQREIAEQIRKDREADRLARERVREQIAQDRAERAKRFQKEKVEREEHAHQAHLARLQAEQQAAAQAEAQRSQFARIQFRLPDGGCVTEQFPSSNTLQTVYNFIRQHLGRDVDLATTFPKRTFSSADMTQTLVDLQLAPSAVIMVLPRGRGEGRVISSSDGGSLLGSLLMAPINVLLFLWSLLQSIFSGSASGGGGAAPARPSSSATAHSSSRATGGDRQQGQAQKRAAANAKKDGNVHRLSDTRDDDDEQNTWNGNSTQQM